MTDNPLDVLGVSHQATVSEVKDAWKKLASIHHPDKGGDASEFNRIRRAYQHALVIAEINDVDAAKCCYCHGSGKVENPQQRGFYTAFKIMCPSCKGSGWNTKLDASKGIDNE